MIIILYCFKPWKKYLSWWNDTIYEKTLTSHSYTVAHIQTNMHESHRCIISNLLINENINVSQLKLNIFHINLIGTMQTVGSYIFVQRNSNRAIPELDFPVSVKPATLYSHHPTVKVHIFLEAFAVICDFHWMLVILLNIFTWWIYLIKTGYISCCCAVLIFTKSSRGSQRFPHYQVSITPPTLPFHSNISLHTF